MVPALLDRMWGCRVSCSETRAPSFGLRPRALTNGNYYRLLGVYRDNGKENGNYYRVLGVYRDNGKENGNYYRLLGVYRDNGKENGNYYIICTNFLLFSYQGHAIMSLCAATHATAFFWFCVCSATVVALLFLPL